MKQQDSPVGSPRPWSRGRHTRIRCGRIALAAGLSLVLVLGLGLAVAAARVADPDDVAHGKVIVQFGDTDLVGREISFTAPISGLAALQMSGLEVVTADTPYGQLVCSIEGVGCPADNCFCDPSKYWGYNYWDGSAWQGYLVGAGGSSLNDGAIEGWRWGEFGDAAWPATPVTAALQALDWLQPKQSLTDGGYGNDGTSAEALLTIGANGLAASGWRRQPDAPSLAAYWLKRAPIYSGAGGAEAGKLAAGLIATETCLPRNTVRPSAFFSPTTGTYDEGAGNQSWAILGTAALSETVPAAALDYLKGLVQPSGGWEWSPGWGPDTSATALALQALIATGEPLTSTLITDGLAYLKTTQNADGGFSYGTGDSDANSTAYVIQALRAAGEDPEGAAWTEGTNTPLSYLLSLQLPNGAFEWQEGNGENVFATLQAVPALLGRPFPLRVAEPTSCTLYLPMVSR